MGTRVLVVEDDAAIRQYLECRLRHHAYDVVLAQTGEQALNLCRCIPFDVVLLDRALPGLDGIDVCRRIRTNKELDEIAVIMVSGHVGEADVVTGLGAGADDYVAKPIRVNELMARMNAVLRRRESLDEDCLERDGLRIDLQSHRVFLHGTERHLTATQFRLLHALARSPERAYSRSQLISLATSGEGLVCDRNIDVHVRVVRRELGSEIIETVRGVGYRFGKAEEKRLLS